MKKYLLFILILIPAALFSQADAIVGKWETDGGKSHIEIYSKGGKFYGKIVWLKEPLNDEGKVKVDKNNPDESKRSRPLKGMELLSSFEYEGDNEWEEGEIYDPESGKTYSCVLTLENENTLDVRGYVGVSWLGRSTTWKRVK